MPKFDVLVIGGGLAGMRAASEAASSAKVALISKVHPLRSHSVAAQGGINAAIGQGDSIKQHFEDTVKGSDHLADQDAVEVLTKEAPEAIFELDRLGTLFTRNADGTLAQRPFGGQDAPRTCFAADRTGHALMYTLYEQLVRQDCRIFPEHTCLELVVRDGRVLGAVVLDIANGRLEAFEARAVIIATGGAGRMFARSTNSLISTGDGTALAFAAGARLKDMEFVQFHPTTLVGTNILFTEGARGEGGHLYDKNGERFLKHYAPKKMELAPRDVITRAMDAEQKKGNAVADRYFWLDLRHLGQEVILSRLPEVYGLAQEFLQLDIVSSPVPVEPAQHYTMGGIATDVNGRTNIEGLYAAGEAACVSVHGANRLGGNSLLETLVFGKRAGLHCAHYLKGGGGGAVPQTVINRHLKKMSDLIRRSDGVSPHHLRKKLQQTNMDSFGISRNARQMRSGLDDLEAITGALNELQVGDKTQLFNTELLAAYELEHMLLLSLAMGRSAMARTESRGAHYRSDHPERDDSSWLKHSICELGDGEITLSYEDVTLKGTPPAERSY